MRQPPVLIAGCGLRNMSSTLIASTMLYRVGLSEANVGFSVDLAQITDISQKLGVASPRLRLGA